MGVDPFPLPDLLGRRLSVASGATLFRQGEKVQTGYLIESGVVKLTQHCDNADLIVALRNSGWLLGATSASVGDEFPLSAETVSECQVRPINVAAVLAACRNNGEMALWLIRMQSREAVETLQTVGVFGTAGPAQRLEFLLSRLAAACGVKQANGSIKLRVHLTQDELALAIGSSREFVNRALMRWKANHRVKVVDGWLVLPSSTDVESFALR